VNKLLFTVIIAVAMSMSSEAQNSAVDIRDFNKLAGCWVSEDKAANTILEEYWMTPKGDAILGMSRTTTNGKMSFYEWMRIESREAGIFFVARPKSNNSDTDFKLISSKAGEFVFENDSHDFPNRVTYRPSAKKMTARIEGKMDGKAAAMDFAFNKAKCP
jgi:hypothetical protein